MGNGSLPRQYPSILPVDMAFLFKQMQGNHGSKDANG